MVIGEVFQYDEFQTYDEFFDLLVIVDADARSRLRRIVEILVGEEEWVVIAKKIEETFPLKVMGVPVHRLGGVSHRLMFVVAD